MHYLQIIIDKSWKFICKIRFELHLMLNNRLMWEHIKVLFDQNSNSFINVFIRIELEEKLKDQVLIDKRRMEQFERKSKEILSIFKHLTGYRISFFETIVKLQTVYMKSKDNFFYSKYVNTLTKCVFMHYDCFLFCF